MGNHCTLVSLAYRSFDIDLLHQRDVIKMTKEPSQAGIISQLSHQIGILVIFRHTNLRIKAINATTNVEILTPTILGTWDSVRSRPSGGGGIPISAYVIRTLRMLCCVESRFRIRVQLITANEIQKEIERGS